jgi:hypothetical protein
MLPDDRALDALLVRRALDVTPVAIRGPTEICLKGRVPRRGTIFSLRLGKFQSVFVTGVWMKRVDTLRLTAQECEPRSDAAKDTEVKKIYQALARQWQEMADQIERQLDW